MGKFDRWRCETLAVLAVMHEAEEDAGRRRKLKELIDLLANPRPPERALALAIRMLVDLGLNTLAPTADEVREFFEEFEREPRKMWEPAVRPDRWWASVTNAATAWKVTFASKWKP